MRATIQPSLPFYHVVSLLFHMCVVVRKPDSIVTLIELDCPSQANGTMY